MLQTERRLLLAVVSVLLASWLLLGQQQPTFSTEVKVVNVLATVRDKQGHIVRDLTKDDFILEEDGRPQTIRYFAQESDLPLTLGLLVDTSLSQRRVLDQERRASYTFLDQILREKKDLAFVIHFDHDAELLKDLTSSRQQLESVLGSLETPEPVRRSGGGWPGGGGGGWPGSRGGRPQAGTVLYDAVFLASDELMKKQAGRKALILLTDGVDTGSQLSLATAIEAAQRADTLVYSILFADPEAYRSPGGFGGPRMGGRGGWGRYPGGGYPRFPQPSYPDGKKVLERLSKETGGGFFEVSKKQPIEQIYERIEEELRHQYNLGYSPDRADAGLGFRKIHLMAKQKDLVVQARDRYYAEP